ncbi:MAG: DNA helicase II, partial [Rhodocyclaceae bacterium]|nr:DNA helicase II [Rhodocyclaceae bacterium]
LMYVAVTRAGARLYLSFAQSRLLHGQVRYGVPSRFIKEIPASLTKWITPRRRAAFFDPAPAPEADTPAPAETEAETETETETEAETESDAPWHAGQLVRHTRFGCGIIIAVEGTGAQCKLQINFGDQGVQWLLAAIAAEHMTAD